MASKRVEIPLPTHFSDGSTEHHPGANSIYKKQPTGQHHEFLLEKVTKLWVEGQDEIATTEGKCH